MIAQAHETILGPEVGRIQVWLGTEGDGAVLMSCIAHQVALHEAKAVESLGKHSLLSMKGEIPIEAQRNLALAEQYRNALIVLQKFSKEQSEFIKTNLPVSHV
jgi:hypothetical protein